MLIRKIKMENFRGFRDKTIDFNNKSIVLLSAANGVGKTTTVDAIEWCLTGEIGRLKNAFDSRSTNATERKMNNNGILKNRDAEEKEKVKVMLWLFNSDKEIMLCREQTNDELNPMASKVTIDQNEEIAEDFIREYVGESFYNFHFCDVQKSFNVQNKKRKDLKDFFSEFITNYDRQKQIADNLGIFAEDVQRYIDDKDKQKVSQDEIKIYKEQLEKVREDAKQIMYPEITLYPDEQIEITKLKKEELVAQRKELENIGYQIAKEKLSRLIKNEEVKNRQTIIKEIITYWETKGKSIQQALKVGFAENDNAITFLHNKLKKLKDLEVSKETILEDEKLLLSLKIDGFTQLEYEEHMNTIKEKKKREKILSDEIELLTANNKMLQLLSSLVANKQVVIEYRNGVVKQNGIVRCPVCGSESFSNINETLILKEADDYIKQNGEAVKEKQMEKTLSQTELETFLQKIINETKSKVKKEMMKLEENIETLKKLKDDVQPYFDMVKRLQKINKGIKINELTAEKATELLLITEQELLEKVEEQKILDFSEKILTVLGYEYKNEMMQQTYEKVTNIITESYNVLEFSYDVFVSKLNAIDSVLANRKLSDLNQKVQECNKKNQKLDMEIEELKKLQSIAFQRAKEIGEVVEKLSKEEYEKVGPAISKLYNKLIRFNTDDRFNIVQEKEGLSLVDNKGKNIVNVLSNGQINVFMLAHFFAGINARNAHEKMKIYFIDDLTACMDDVNMLAFMDLLKYQLSSKSTVDQLFFITCDERISNLLKYKLHGRGIELCELLEPDFVL